MVIKEVTDNKVWYCSRATVSLSMKFTTIENWFAKKKKRNVPGDIITLFVLSVICRRHTIVFTKSKPWRTGEVDRDDTAQDVINKCETHLLYLGSQLFGMLCPHPFSVFPPRCFNLRVMQCLHREDREDGQLLIKEHSLDLSCTSKIKLTSEKKKIPIANDDILIRNDESKDKAKAPPLFVLGEDDAENEVNVVGSFGPMDGFRAFTNASASNENKA